MWRSLANPQKEISIRRLTTGGASAALVASIFHYGTHTVGEAKAFLTARGVPMRPVA